MDNIKGIVKKKKSKRGFTMVEIIIVIAVLLILAALIVPRVTKYVDDAKSLKYDGDVQATYEAVNKATMKMIAEEHDPFYNGSQGYGPTNVALPEHSKKLLPYLSEVIECEVITGNSDAKDNGIKIGDDVLIVDQLWKTDKNTDGIERYAIAVVPNKKGQFNHIAIIRTDEDATVNKRKTSIDGGEFFIDYNSNGIPNGGGADSNGNYFSGKYILPD
ncbi:MAG: prepilin-type N-terminal cleavage/methylation domain-containing protein [Lachnospirales bacterium]